MKKLLLLITNNPEHSGRILRISRVVLLVTFVINSLLVTAQSAKTDSLLSVLKTAKEDTNKVKTLNALVNQYISSEPQKSFAYSQQALSLAQQLKWKEGIANSFHSIGYYYYTQADYPNALAHWLNALKIREATGDKKGISTSLGSIGNVYLSQADYPKALDYYFKALKMAAELGNKNLIAIWLGNIGIVYMEQADYPKALDYYFKRLKMDEESGNKSNMAINLGNIGIVYKEQKDYPKALEYYFKALKMDEELGRKSGIAANLGSIGALYTSTGRYKEAEDYLKHALSLSDSIGDLYGVMDVNQHLSNLYSQLPTPNYQLSFAHYKQYIIYRDSINNEENTKKQTRTEMTYEFDKKETAAKAEQDKKDVLAAEELKQQRQQRNYFIIGFALVLLLALFIFRANRQKQKANVIISQQKELVEEKNKLVEEKNKDITDSITYAKRIQEALLPAKEIKYRIFPDAFVLYHPRDIVSGDFYWFTEKNGRRLIAAVDCTGHGVPGAFMSMIGNTFLNEIVNEKGITTPSEILNQLHGMIISSLKQSEQGESKDGMDVAIISLKSNVQNIKLNDGEKIEIEFAGANNPLWIVRSMELEVGSKINSKDSELQSPNPKLIEVKADKQPIGFYSGKSVPFTNNIITLQKDDSLYIFTDGFADQFGGGKGKKFKDKQLKEILLSIQNEPMMKQEEILFQKFNDWKGNLEQVDDVLVIGIKV